MVIHNTVFKESERSGRSVFHVHSNTLPPYLLAPPLTQSLFNTNIHYPRQSFFLRTPPSSALAFIFCFLLCVGHPVPLCAMPSTFEYKSPRKIMPFPPSTSTSTSLFLFLLLLFLISHNKTSSSSSHDFLHRDPSPLSLFSTTLSYLIDPLVLCLSTNPPTLNKPFLSSSH